MEGDLIGPLVDTAGDEAACMSFQDGENDTHTSKIPYNKWFRQNWFLTVAKLDKKEKSEIELIMLDHPTKNHLKISGCEIGRKAN